MKLVDQKFLRLLAVLLISIFSSIRGSGMSVPPEVTGHTRTAKIQEARTQAIRTLENILQDARENSDAGRWQNATRQYHQVWSRLVNDESFRKRVEQQSNIRFEDVSEDFREALDKWNNQEKQRRSIQVGTEERDRYCGELFDNDLHFTSSCLQK